MDYLSDALNNFKCYKDIDIETFLNSKALEFIKRGLCSVYLIVNEQAFDKGYIQIEAYFTLSHKTLIPEGISKNKIKTVSGFNNTTSIHFVLIGQLGKYIQKTNDNIISSKITGKEILDYAFDIIRTASDLIPCRCVLVECKEDQKVQKVYKDYNFSFLQYDNHHYQFYKRI